jgi:hypothetical protein
VKSSIFIYWNEKTINSTSFLIYCLFIGYMSQYKFIDSTLEDDIMYNIVPSIFPSLNHTHTKLLTKYLIRLINVIALCFGFTKGEYDAQLRQNNYQDMKWLLIHLLPFLNDSKGLKDIEMLDDIYDAKVVPSDPNNGEVKYAYSNLQYNRCLRGEEYKERPFNKVYLEHNLYLLMGTIKIMAHKMLVNWMDIIPYDLASFKEKALYKETETAFNEKRLTDWDPTIDASLDKTDDMVCNTLHEKIHGLPIDDIYNTLSVDLYHSIKYIKWLIYDMPLDTDGTVPLIMILKIFFNTGIMTANTGIEWHLLKDSVNQEFTNNWNEMVGTCNSGNGASLYGITSLSGLTMRRMMKAIILAFNTGYRKMNDAISDGYLAINKNTDDDDDNVDITSYDELRPAIISVGPKHIYEFMRTCLQQFKGTWYGYQMMNAEKTDILDLVIKELLEQNDISLDVGKTKKYYQDFHIIQHEGIQVQISHKNVYNYAKSLVHYTENKQWLEYPKLWVSLTQPAKEEILKRLNVEYKNPFDWFNISRYIEMLNLRQIAGFKGTTEEFNNVLHDGIRETLPTVIFQTMITRGILTSFTPNKQVTDENITPKDNVARALSKKIFKISHKNTVWTSAYHYMTTIPYKHMKPFMYKETEHNIFTYNAIIPWYTASALDWVAQIGFAHHFIHNRVSFITGATGVGKSTQVPNLFLYYLKAIDYNNAGKVVCSQPRITPTEQNAKIVAEWFGVPIKYSNGKEDVYSETNYYVQMQHSKKPHIKDTESPMLKYITDGGLVLEIGDPLLKQQRKDGTFLDRNVYDVIMIDEAHEHNKSMDMLLTLLRLPATYNNSLRVVILSATMDEDEPRYRRYFRNINDNRKYPLNQWISTSKLDRINVDRRYHISAPGKTTRYVVDDIYVPDQDEMTTVLDIVQKTTEGDILVFQAGLGDINTLITELNPKLPSDVIALPYHAQLSELHRPFVENIAETKSMLKISKDVVFTEQMNLTEGTGSYNRVVIVATNVAEASITIPTLKFVVDTGTQKINVYDYKKRSDILKKLNISLASLMQRRGRVGRKASGTVYHLYEKGKMDNNKTSYHISIHNMSLDIYRKTRNSSSETEFVLTSHDPNNNKKIFNYDDVKTGSKVYSSDIASFLRNHYFTEEQYYSYYGNDAHYDYNNYMSPTPYFQTGYSIETLVDNAGSFYIIHPDELLLERNIGGEIVKTVSDDSITYDNKQIISQKTISFCRILYDYMYLALKDKNVDKTALGNNIMGLMDKLQIEDHSMLRTVIFGMALGCEDVFKIISLYRAIQYDVKELLERDRLGRLTINKLSDCLNAGTSDTDRLIGLLNDFHKFVNSIGIAMELTDRKYVSTTKKMKSKYNMTADEYIYLLDPMNNVKNLTKRINKDDKSILKEFQKDLTNVFMSQLSESGTLIEEWCNNRSINIKTLGKYIREYTGLKTEISKSMTPEMLTFITSLSNVFKNSTLGLKSTNLLTIALLFGFPFNVCKKIIGSSHYVSCYTPALDNVYTIGSLAFTRFIPNTLVSPMYLENYLLYLKINIETDTIMSLHHITPTDISIINHIYRPSLYDECEIAKHDITKYVDTIMASTSIEPAMIGKLGKLVTTIVETISETKLDITRSYDVDMHRLNRRIMELT